MIKYHNAMLVVRKTIKGLFLYDKYKIQDYSSIMQIMAVLYDIDVRIISDHIQKVYEDSELEKEAAIRKFRIVQHEGNRDVQRQIAKDYTIKGWMMSD